MLPALLDCIVPPEGAMPGAGSLAERFERELARHERWAPVRALVALVPAALAGAPPEGRAARLQELERAHPVAFAALVQLVYGIYYTDQGVLELIEGESGYPARPPQPLGYPLRPFDESLLERVRRLAPSYRPDTETR